jgi:membrane fusion protein (multidrug efflux system)
MGKYINHFSLLAFALLTFALQSCSSDAKPDPKENKAPKNSVSFVSPTEESLNGTVVIPGELQAYQQVDLYAKVNSFVNKILVDVGSEVKQGQLLVVLDAPELKSQQNAALSRLESQQAKYIASKASYDRLLKTSKTPGTISQNDLELALSKQQSDLAEFKAAQANHREALDTRAYLQIRAPFKGIITARNVSAGAFVGSAGAQTPIFTLVEHKRLRLVASVPEAYSVYLAKKNAVKFAVTSLPKDTLFGKISRSAGALDSRLRSQRIELDVQNSQNKLLPGMIAQIFIPLQSDAAPLTVPKSAILNCTLGTFVIRKKDNKAEWVPVKIGIETKEKTEIIGQLTKLDQLVEKASEEIRDGSSIN